jgi:hypothetical protein
MRAQVEEPCPCASCSCDGIVCAEASMGFYRGAECWEAESRLMVAVPRSRAGWELPFHVAGGAGSQWEP